MGTYPVSYTHLDVYKRQVFHGSKGSVLDHVAIGIVGALPDAGGVPDVGHLSDVVVGDLPSWRIVTVGDGDKFSGERSIGCLLYTSG